MIGTVVSNIGGKQRTLKFNLNANYEFCKLHNLRPDQVPGFVTDVLNVTAIRDMIYCALLASDLGAGMPIDYNQYTVGEWIEALEQSDLERIVLGHTESYPVIDGKKKAKSQTP